MKEWIRQNVDLTILLMLVVMAAGLWGFIEIADEVLEGQSDTYDQMIVDFFGIGHDAQRSRLAEEIWRDFTALGGIAVMTLASVSVAGYFLIRKKYALLVLLIAAVSGGVLLSLLLKNIFDRPRPEYAGSLTYIMTSSFPSGHSMLSAVTYLTLGVMLASNHRQRRLKIYFLTLAVLLTVLTGLSRVYLGVHYPTDVLAGWMAGLVWAVFCWLVAAFLQNKGRVESPQ
jgi:undecaprenyl-diphosphatase